MTVITLGTGLHGITSDTPGRLILDAGIVYKDIDVAALRLATTAAGVSLALQAGELLGATRGGAVLNPNKTMRHVEVDGRRFPIKGMQRIDEYSPEMTVTVLEMTVENFQISLAPLYTDEQTLYTEVYPAVEVKDSDYLDNIALVATFTGSDNPVIVVLENAMVIESVEVPFEDKNETAMEITLVGHADASTPHESPMRFFLPVEAAVS